MNIPPKYEDVVAELETEREMSASTLGELEDLVEKLNNALGENDALQQRLNVAENRAGDPVTMTLPDRLPVRMPDCRNLPKGHAEAWNSCIEEVIRLNGLKP